MGYVLEAGAGSAGGNPDVGGFEAAYTMLTNAAEFRADLLAGGAIPGTILFLFAVPGIADTSFQACFRIHDATSSPISGNPDI